MRINKTVSLSRKEFAWARKQMDDNDWTRAGDSAGISRYVQELIRKDMPPEWQPPAPQDTTKAKPIRRLATRKRS